MPLKKPIRKVSAAKLVKKSVAVLPHSPVEAITPVEVLPRRPMAPIGEDWIDGGHTFDDPKDAVLFQKRIEANIKLLQYKRLTNELIERSLVLEMAAENSRKQRDELNALIDRMSPELAALTDPKMIRNYLQERFHTFFQDLERAWLYPKRAI